MFTICRHVSHIRLAEADSGLGFITPPVVITVGIAT